MKRICYQVHATRNMQKQLDTVKIDNINICEIIEEVHRRDEFDKGFDIGLTPKCKYYEDIIESEEEISDESDNEEIDEL